MKFTFPQAPTSTLTPLTLQEALEVFHPQFIVQSKKRERRVREKGRERQRREEKIRREERLRREERRPNPIGSGTETDRTPKFFHVGMFSFSYCVCMLAFHQLQYGKAHTISNKEGKPGFEAVCMCDAVYCADVRRNRPRMSTREMYEQSKRYAHDMCKLVLVHGIKISSIVYIHI